MCTLPEDPEMARFNREHKDPVTLAKEGIITISGEINEQMVQRIRDMLALAETAQVQKLEIRIESNGGDVDAGLEICDLLRAAPVELRIGVVHHFARSMALVILQECDRREATLHARFLLHRTKFEGMTTEELRDPSFIQKVLTLTDLDERHMDDILVSRTGRTLAEIKAASNKVVDMTSMEALRFGLIDSIHE